MTPKWQPQAPSAAAVAMHEAQIGREIWTRTIARNANLLARLEPAQPQALKQMADDYVPEVAVAFGGVTTITLRGAAAFLLNLAAVWKDETP